MEITCYTESLQYNLEAAARVIQEAISLKFKNNNFGISYDEFIILDEISHNPGILQIELARKILKGRAYTGKFLSSLEDKGFIERRKSIKGKRQVIMPNYITSNGRKVLKVGIETVRNFVDFVPTIENEKNIDYILTFMKKLKSEVQENYDVKFE
ncbi:MarR family transcriptional regulator [bacterium]|nr:MarR family transcriptional regulator [bacterium]